MDLETYQELTGNTVDSDDVAKVTAQIRRTRITLESMLGYSLVKKKAGLNQYEEKGKAKGDCIFTGYPYDINTSDLDPADTVSGSYRLFPYNSSDEYFKVDPFTTLYKVKLVFVQGGGDEKNGITHKTFSSDRIRVHSQNGVTKYIERCKECLCTCVCKNQCVQLAVDADWLNEECIPEELLMVWADMIEYYADEKKDIKSETLATHSYTKNTQAKPEELPESIKIIQKYAGPSGSSSPIIAV